MVKKVVVGYAALCCLMAESVVLVVPHIGVVSEAVADSVDQGFATGR